MRTKIIKKTDQSDNVYFEESRIMKKVLLKNGKYRFKDLQNNIILPTNEELELFNESETSGIKITNGWLTFIGVLTLLNLILEIVLLTKIVN